MHAPGHFFLYDLMPPPSFLMSNMGSQPKSKDLEFTTQIQFCQTTDNPQTSTILFIPDKSPIRQENSSFFALPWPLKVDFSCFLPVFPFRTVLRQKGPVQTVVKASAIRSVQLPLAGNF
jgi:hypothetical protein